MSKTNSEDKNQLINGDPISDIEKAKVKCYMPTYSRRLGGLCNLLEEIESKIQYLEYVACKDVDWDNYRPCSSLGLYHICSNIAADVEVVRQVVSNIHNDTDYFLLIKERESAEYIKQSKGGK